MPLYDAYERPLLESVKSDEPPKHYQERAAEDEGTKEEATVIPIFPSARTEFSVHPALVAQWRSDQEDNERHNRKTRTIQWLTLISTFLAFLAAGVYAWIANSSLSEIRNQTDKIASQAVAAQKQADIMQRQLEVTDRPWIEVVSATITSNLYISQKPKPGPQPVMTMAVQIRGKNVGRSVAQNVKLKSDMVFESPWGFGEDALQTQKVVCSREHAVNITRALTLFPDQETREGRLHGEFWSAISNAAINPESDANMIQPMVVGCIVYDIPGASDNPHHTGFIYEVEPEVGKDIEIPFRITFALGKVFLQSHLRLREFEGFSDAN